MFESFIGVNFWTALAVLINTLLIYFVGKKFLFGPVKNMIDSRQKEIDDMYAQANETKAQAEAMEQEYSRRLAEAGATSEQIVREAVSRGQAREQSIVREANEKASAMLDKARADIAKETKQAMEEIRNDISDMAVSIASKVVEKEISEKDHEKLIRDFIDRMGDDL